MCSASLGALSAEVVLRVLDHLDDARDVVQIRQVSRRLHSLAGDTLVSTGEGHSDEPRRMRESH